jgi:hypothetical protein
MWASRRCSTRSLAGTRFVRLVHQARSASSFSQLMPQYSYLQQTKHFQTLFWTPEVRLVDCPGLVVPNLIPLELQVIWLLPATYMQHSDKPRSSAAFCPYLESRRFLHAYTTLPISSLSSGFSVWSTLPYRRRQ